MIQIHVYNSMRLIFIFPTNTRPHFVLNNNHMKFEQIFAAVLLEI